MRPRPPSTPFRQTDVPAGGWLVNGRSRELLHFKPVHNGSGDWIELRCFHWVPPHPPVPQNRRLISLDDAMEHWSQLRSRGWRRVQPSTF